MTRNDTDVIPEPRIGQVGSRTERAGLGATALLLGIVGTAAGAGITTVNRPSRSARLQSTGAPSTVITVITAGWIAMLVPSTPLPRMVPTTTNSRLSPAAVTSGTWSGEVGSPTTGGAPGRRLTGMYQLTANPTSAANPAMAKTPW